jgi:hypothetical protein
MKTGAKPTFTTGEIISAVTGRLCCPIDGVYRALNYLTGDSLFTHQLPRAGRACEEWVRKQHPWLDELDVEACTRETWKAWLNDAIGKYGEVFVLEPLPAGQWQSRDPIEEAVDMMGGKQAKEEQS